MFSNDYGIMILPQHEITMVMVKGIKNKLFKRQITAGIGTATFYVVIHNAAHYTVKRGKY
jgi:hypothetical protein